MYSLAASNACTIRSCISGPALTLPRVSGSGFHVVGNARTPLDPARMIPQCTSIIVCQGCEQGLTDGAVPATRPFRLPRLVHQNGRARYCGERCSAGFSLVFMDTVPTTLESMQRAARLLLESFGQLAINATLFFLVRLAKPPLWSHIAVLLFLCLSVEDLQRTCEV